MDNNTLATVNNLQVCTFMLDDRLFGFDILDIKEVESDISFTPIFHSTDKVLGYVNIRGSVHLVLDMRKIMGFEEKGLNRNSRIILFKSSVGESFGVLVDKVWNVVDVDFDRIENKCSHDVSVESMDSKAENEIAVGVYKLERKLLVILNARKLLSLIRN